MNLASSFARGVRFGYAINLSPFSSIHICDDVIHEHLTFLLVNKSSIV
jgi:hypothetical protein